MILLSIHLICCNTNDKALTLYTSFTLSNTFCTMQRSFLVKISFYTVLYVSNIAVVVNILAINIKGFQSPGKNPQTLYV